MFITKEQFKELTQKAVSCLATPRYVKYRLEDGSAVYSYVGSGYTHIFKKING